MTFIIKILKKMGISRSLFGDFMLFVLTCVGYFPLHIFRKGVYRLTGLRFGRDTSFHWRLRFFHPKGIMIGRNTIIGCDSFLDGRNGLIIGDNVNISSGVMIWTEQHDYNDPMFTNVGSQVKIEDFTWVSCRAILLPGVTIGEGAVVAAGAVVAKDVEPYSVVGGVPAKKIGVRPKNLRYKLNYHKAFQ